MMNPLRILVADDHVIYRDGVKMLLESIENIQVVGQAATGAETIRLALEYKPDVILMDVRMPEGNGIEATAEILSVLPNTAVLMVTMLDEDDSVFAAMRYGARGYILKGADQSEMMRAIEAVANGEAIFSPNIASKMMRYFQNIQNQPKPEQTHFPKLARREWMVLDLIVQGKKNDEIAEKLKITPKTVRNYIHSIYDKLKVANRAQAVLHIQKHHINTKAYSDA